MSGEIYWSYETYRIFECEPAIEAMQDVGGEPTVASKRIEDGQLLIQFAYASVLARSIITDV